MLTVIEYCKPLTVFNFNFTNCVFGHRFFCKRHFDSIFITFTGSVLSVADCISIEHRLLFQNCDFVQSTLETRCCTFYAVFKAKFKISLVNAKRLLCIFTCTEASSNRLTYIWLPRGAVENTTMVIATAKLRCIGNRALLNNFQIDVKFYSYFMPSLFQSLSFFKNHFRL